MKVVSKYTSYMNNVQIYSSLIRCSIGVLHSTGTITLKANSMFQIVIF